jgi:hypothetical protein
VRGGSARLLLQLRGAPRTPGTTTPLVSRPGVRSPSVTPSSARTAPRRAALEAGADPADKAQI